MIKLRPYQEDTINSIKKYISDGFKSLIVTAPTGAGKTVMFSYICSGASKKGNKVLILTERAELLLQTGGTLRKFNLNPFFIQAGIKYINKNHSVYVAMAQTLRNRINNPIWKSWIKSIDIFIIDEAHKQDFNYLFESGLLLGKTVLGFTATPKRSGKMRQLALDYEKIVESVSVSELIELGYLVPDDYYGMESPDMSNVKYNYMKGDYDERQMFNSYNTPKLYAGVVKNWQNIASGTQTLVFCVNIEHAIKTTLEFRSLGIDARFIVSGVSKPKKHKDPTPGQETLYYERLRVYNLYTKYFSMYSGERRFIFDKFQSKVFPVLVNAGIATTGYDNPSIETIIVNRATTSQTLWLQMIGRGSRPNEIANKTHFNILDFGDNASRLGHYTTPQLWSLWHEAKDGKGLPPLKQCGIDSKGRPISDKKGCDRMILASMKICPFCGFKYPEKKLSKEIDLEHLMIMNGKVKKIKKIDEMTDDELYTFWRAKRYKSAWLWMQLWFRGGEDKIIEFGKEKRWSKGVIDRAIKYNQIA